MGRTATRTGAPDLVPNRREGLVDWGDGHWTYKSAGRLVEGRTATLAGPDPIPDPNGGRVDDRHGHWAYDCPTGFSSRSSVASGLRAIGQPRTCCSMRAAGPLQTAQLVATQQGYSDTSR